MTDINKSMQVGAGFTGGTIHVSPKSQWIGASFDQVEFVFPEDTTQMQDVFLGCHFERCDGLPYDISRLSKNCFFANSVSKVLFTEDRGNFYDIDGSRPLGRAGLNKFPPGFKIQEVTLTVLDEHRVLSLTVLHEDSGNTWTYSGAIHAKTVQPSLVFNSEGVCTGSTADRHG